MQRRSPKAKVSALGKYGFGVVLARCAAGPYGRRVMFGTINAGLGRRDGRTACLLCLYAASQLVASLYVISPPR